MHCMCCICFHLFPSVFHFIIFLFNKSCKENPIDVNGPQSIHCLNLEFVCIMQLIDWKLISNKKNTFKIYHNIKLKQKNPITNLSTARFIEQRPNDQDRTKCNICFFSSKSIANLCTAKVIQNKQVKTYIAYFDVICSNLSTA